MQLERAQKDGILHVPYSDFLNVVRTAEEAMEICVEQCRVDANGQNEGTKESRAATGTAAARTEKVSAGQ